MIWVRNITNQELKAILEKIFQENGNNLTVSVVRDDYGKEYIMVEGKNALSILSQTLKPLNFSGTNLTFIKEEDTDMVIFTLDLELKRAPEIP